MSVLARLLRLFAASVVPGGGFLLGGWSPATALTLYWIDNVAGALAMSVRIALHRRWTGLAGHGRAHLNATATMTVGGKTEKVTFKSFLNEFLLTTIAFNIAQGIFLAAVLGVLGARPEAEPLRQGAIAIVLCHALALSFDAVRLHEWPFARLRDQALRVMGRVVLVHMALLGGMMFFAWRGTPGAFFAVFVWLKFLSDVGTLLPQWNPREAPSVLVRVMNLFPQRNGESFEEYWRRTRAEEQAQFAQDEQLAHEGLAAPDRQVDQHTPAARVSRKPKRAKRR